MKKKYDVFQSMQRGVVLFIIITILVFCIVGALEESLNPASWSNAASVAFAVGVFCAALVGMQHAIEICDFKSKDDGKGI